MSGKVRIVGAKKQRQPLQPNLYHSDKTAHRSYVDSVNGATNQGQVNEDPAHYAQHGAEPQTPAPQFSKPRRAAEDELSEIAGKKLQRSPLAGEAGLLKGEEGDVLYHSQERGLHTKKGGQVKVSGDMAVGRPEKKL